MPTSAPVEAVWRLATDTFTDFQLKTIVTFVIHEIFYWGSFFPFYIADSIPYFRRWKVQDDKPNTSEAQMNCTRRVLVNHLFLVLPIIVFTHPLFDFVGMPSSVETLPSTSYLILQVAFFFLVEDFIFYWGHRALHTPYLYKHVHSVHHHHAAPFGIAAEYAHPFEVLFLGTATIAGPLLIPPHLFTLQVYLALRCMQTVECHSGYDFPWSLNRFFPLYGGAYFHDHHHRIHSGNYSSTFIWVDALFGTDVAFQNWRRKQAIRANSETATKLKN